MISDRARATAAKYRGAIAEGYDAKRVDQAKWVAEQGVLAQWLSQEAPGTTVLDCPTGTGRLIPAFREFGLQALCVDISHDMLRQARDRFGLGNGIAYRHGDVFDLETDDAAFDVTCCIRLLNLIEPTDMQQVLGELQRVTRRRIIFNLRVWHAGTAYRHPQRLADVIDVLKSGWAIARNVALHEDDFRMIELTRSA